MVVPAAGRAAHTRWVAAASRGLDDQALAAAWAEGRALTFEQAVALAVAGVPPGAPSGRRGARAASGASGDSPGSPLTPREREVALLAAGGLSSPAIAERLVVSVRTVDNHLQRVYGKLGIGGRGELPAALE
jgi:DNA-binding NarL/FixJ family response regulator